ncbi:hypothetical protein ACQJBY_024275 [Aegilops geniculata]
MPRMKHTSHKSSRGVSARASRRGRSDDSQEHQRPFKRAGNVFWSRTLLLRALTMKRTCNMKSALSMWLFQSVLQVLRGPPTRLLFLRFSQMRMVVAYLLRLLNFMGVSSRISPKCPSMHILSSVMMLINSRWFKTLDQCFRTNVQADIYTSVVLPKGLSLHHFIDLEYIQAHPMKYLGAIDLIELSGLAAPFAFQHDFNSAVIHQFYATCFFGPNKTVTWMTSDTELTATYAQFVAALGFPDIGFKIHKDDPNHKPKAVEACGYLLKELDDLAEEEKMKDLNQVSIWRSPYYIIYQCVIRTIYPKMGDKGSCSSYCIDLMSRLYESPKGKINVPHFLWHEIRLASFQYKHAFPQAPFIQALIESVAPFSLYRTHVHEKWITNGWAPKGSSKYAPARRSAAQSHPSTSNSVFVGRLARFLEKAHSAMMKAFTFSCTQNHDVVTHLITSKNALKSRMWDSGAPDVSDDERLSVAPPSDFGFPSGPEWVDFLDDASGSGAHNDDVDDDL